MIPIKDGDLSIRTPWHPASINPARPGWYEVRMWLATMRHWACEEFHYWDGSAWWNDPEDPDYGDSFFGGQDRDQWRGRVAP